MSIDPEDAAPVVAAHKAAADKRLREVLATSIAEVEVLEAGATDQVVPLEAALKAMTRAANSAFETGCDIGKLEAADEAEVLRTELAAVRAENARLASYVDFLLHDRSSLHPMFGGVPNIRDLCYNAFMRAKDKNNEDGGPTDWFTDTLPLVNNGIESMRAALAAKESK